MVDHIIEQASSPLLLSKEISSAASSKIELANFTGILAPLDWVHQDEDDRGTEFAFLAPRRRNWPVGCLGVGEAGYDVASPAAPFSCLLTYPYFEQHPVNGWSLVLGTTVYTCQLLEQLESCWRGIRTPFSRQKTPRPQQRWPMERRNVSRCPNPAQPQCPPPTLHSRPICQKHWILQEL